MRADKVKLHRYWPVLLNNVFSSSISMMKNDFPLLLNGKSLVERSAHLKGNNNLSNIILGTMKMLKEIFITV